MNYELKKAALVTGASSGIGWAVARRLAADGYTVYGLCRREMPESGGGIIWLQADVTVQDEIDAAVKTLYDKEQRLDVVVQSAGMGIAGAAEANNDGEIERQMGVNFTGSVRVLRAVLPLMREQRSGKIIQIGSVAGRIAVPFQGFYSASKFALEGLYEALRLEIKPFGVQATVVEPGDTKTDFTAARVFAENPMDEYEAVMRRAVGVMERDEQRGVPPEKVAKTVARLCRKKRLPVRVAVGWDYKLLCAAKAVLPGRLVEWVLRKKYL